MKTITIKDRTFGGGSINEIDLRLESEEITVKDLIISRVKREVEIYNSEMDVAYSGLVVPNKIEELLNRKKSGSRRKVDFEKQSYQALAGFQNNQFFVIINDKQVDDLEQRIDVLSIKEVEFIKLTPLVGG